MQVEVKKKKETAKKKKRIHMWGNTIKKIRKNGRMEEWKNGR